jgi:cytochrome c551
MALAVLLLLCACGLKTDDSDLRPSATIVKEGGAAALYKKQCVSCHAVDLSGRVGPSLQKVGSRLTEEQLIAIIEEGVKGMPSYKNRLDRQEIEALAQWLVIMR